MIHELYEICQEFKSTTGRNDKKALLEREINNETFKQYIKYVLDPLSVYGLQDKKIKKFLGKIKSQDMSGINNLFDLFEYLLENNTGTDEDAKRVAFFIDSYDDEEIQKFLLESITKKIKLGITGKTVNEVWGRGFINNFEVMLAHPFKKYPNHLEGKEFVLTEKYDGCRAIFIKKNGKVKVYSRKGLLYRGLSEIEKEISMLPDSVYDGELLIKNYESLVDRDVFQATDSIVSSDGEKKGLDFIIFDAVPISDFEKGHSKDNYLERRTFLESCMEIGNFRNIKLAPILYKGKDLSVIPKLLNKMDSEGREGLMANVALAPYQFKRTKDLLKFKTMKTFDEFCTGVFEGEGKYKGMLGGITVNYKGHSLRIGSGFTDSQRIEYWENPSSIIGKIVEIQYFRESSNKDGELSVSFPVFKAIRTDKSEPNYD